MSAAGFRSPAALQEHWTCMKGRMKQRTSLRLASTLAVSLRGVSLGATPAGIPRGRRGPTEATYWTRSGSSSGRGQDVNAAQADGHDGAALGGAWMAIPRDRRGPPLRWCGRGASDALGCLHSARTWLPSSCDKRRSCEVLLACGSRPERASPDTGVTALHFAAEANSAASVIRDSGEVAGADIDARGHATQARTPLMFAASYGTGPTRSSALIAGRRRPVDDHDGADRLRGRLARRPTNEEDRSPPRIRHSSGVHGSGRGRAEPASGRGGFPGPQRPAQQAPSRHNSRVSRAQQASAQLGRGTPSQPDPDGSRARTNDERRSRMQEPDDEPEERRARTCPGPFLRPNRSAKQGGFTCAPLRGA